MVAGRRPRPARADAPVRASERVLRRERSIAWLRALMVAVSAVVYVASVGIRRPWGPVPTGVLVAGAAYALWALLARPFERLPAARFGAASRLLDAGFITLWCMVTGGPRSEFWVLYVLSVISVAMCYDLEQVLGAALGESALYVAAMSAAGGLSPASLALRPAVVLVAGLGVGLLARQERTGEQERSAYRRMAAETMEMLAAEREHLERLQELDRTKTDVVAAAAHDLRAPLAGILGVIETLRAHGARLDEETRDDLLDGAAEESVRLSRLVEDLLTVSRIETGPVPLDVRDSDVRELIQDAVRAAGTDQVTAVEVAGVDRLRCDPDLVVRVLTNLLDNAAKYSPSGSPIQVRVGRAGDGVSFSVRDHGPGVPPEERERIFERFLRLGEPSGRRGAGLGLYIARGLVRTHGGRIEVGGPPGGGAVFSFTIPPIAEDDPAREDASAAPVAARQT